jgi:hypothetical protein
MMNREGYDAASISLKTGLSENTVKKILNGAGGVSGFDGSFQWVVDDNSMKEVALSGLHSSTIQSLIRRNVWRRADLENHFTGRRHESRLESLSIEGQVAICEWLGLETPDPPHNRISLKRVRSKNGGYALEDFI